MNPQGLQSAAARAAAAILYKSAQVGRRCGQSRVRGEILSRTPLFDERVSGPSGPLLLVLGTGTGLIGYLMRCTRV